MVLPAPGAPLSESLRRKLLRWTILFWTGFLLLDIAKDQLQVRIAGVEVTRQVFLQMVSESVIFWGLWAAMTPVVFALATRLPPWRFSRIKYLTLQSLLALGLSAAHIFATAALFRLRDIPRPEGWTVFHQFVAMAGSLLLMDVFVFWSLVALVTAVWWFEAWRRSKEAEDSLSRQVALLEAAGLRARLDALRRQLDPHFLFNTLNAIAGLARMGETKRVTAMLAHLGEFLRVGLEDDDVQEVPLETELRYLGLYLDIEQERFLDRLRVETNIPDDLKPGLVPVLILQPIVENAVRHGIGPDGGGLVKLTGRRDDGVLVIRVTDSGPGFGDRGEEGVGMANTRARLQHLYGPEAALRVENGREPGAGASVSIVVPWHTERVLPPEMA